MYKNKKILITGGTGSLGQNLTKRLLKEGVETIRILSRNENKQVTMRNEFQDERLRFLIGDIRDKERVEKAFEDIDIVFHTAALKHVDLIEYNPSEAIKTNIMGSQNVIDAAIKQNVNVVVGIGTDKAVSPLNTYGATKLVMEKLFVSANHFKSSKHKTKFFPLRYGNVVASSGSVIPKFIEQIKKKKEITVTDPDMTRFSITMNHALDFILNCVKKSNGGEIFIPKLKAYKISTIEEVLKELLGKFKVKKIPIRPGEKMHETLINENEIQITLESKEDFMIVEPQYRFGYPISKLPKRLKNYNISSLNEPYSSDRVDLLSKTEIRKIILNTKLI
jgi:UDP-N-acetylglucosamine 4,6-dehydratase/5-epimerase